MRDKDDYIPVLEKALGLPPRTAVSILLAFKEELSALHAKCNDVIFSSKANIAQQKYRKAIDFIDESIIEMVAE